MKQLIHVLMLIVCLAGAAHSPIPAYGAEPIKIGILAFVVPADYSQVEDVLGELRIPPFEVAPGFTLHDVWARYRWQTIGALLAGGVTLLLSVSVLLMYRKLAANHQVVLLQKQKLQENEEKFRTVADYTYGWELWEDSAGTCLYCSPACERVTGYTPDAFMGDSGLMLRLIHPDDLPKWQAHYATMHDETKRPKIAQGQTNELAFRIFPADGEVRWIEHLCYHIHDAEGHDLGIRISNRDITERKQSAKALEEAELRFKAIFNAAIDGILVTDTQTKTFVMGNSAICDMLGYQSDELHSLGIADIHPAEALPAVLQQFERQAKGEIRVASDLPLQRKDGSVFYADISGTSMFFGGRPLLVGVFHDVTERKQNEEKIRQLNEELEEKVRARTQQLLDAREKLEAHVAEINQSHDALNQALDYANTLIRSSPDGVIAVDLELRITEWNLLMEQMCGKKREQALGLDLAELPFMKETGEAARIREGFEGQNIGPREVAYQLPGMDKESFFESIMAPLRGHAGKIVGAVLRVRDITQRKRVEESVIESKNRLRTVLESVQAGIVIIDPEVHKIVDANPFAAHMIGAPKESIIGAECHKFICPAEREQCPFTDLHQTIDNSERVLLTAAGERREIIKTVTTIQLGGRPHLLESFIDITERKQAEEKILQLNKSLQEKIQQLLAAREDLVRKEKLALLGQVVGSVGHELRNPLAVMNNAVYFLQTVLADGDETTREYLEIIKDGVVDAESIVSDLLDSVRTKPPQPTAVSVGELIDQTLHTLTVSATITVTLDIPETLPRVRVDGRQIQQVFRNLISNGVEAMPEGGTLAINAVANSQEGTVSVSVGDTGCGMTSEVLANLFQPLITTKARGIGLGLVVVKNLTEANGGTIEVNSQPGMGTVFTVRLPVEMESVTNSQNKSTGRNGQLEGEKSI
jgi:PAS domain S-box-containing protein